MFPTVKSLFKQCATYWGSRGDWLAVASVHRDADILEQSNFAAFTAALGGESEHVAIERASHWAVGWVDRLIIDPTASNVVAKAESLAARLEDYPVIDDDDFSRREWEARSESWESYGRSDFIAAIRESFGDEYADFLDDFPQVADELGRDIEGHPEGQGWHFDIARAVDALTDKTLADHCRPACPVDYSQAKLFGDSRGDYAPL
jgi:hypothetical protein